MLLRLGVDIACRAAHQASLADEQGRFIWSGRRFRTTSADLEQLWSMLPAGHDPGGVIVVMEPTRNAWVPLAAWFRRRGAQVVLVPPERSADLRAYYAKHTRPIGLIRSCWLGCRCCTRTVCTWRKASDRVGR